MIFIDRFRQNSIDLGIKELFKLSKSLINFKYQYFIFRNKDIINDEIVKFLASLDFGDKLIYLSFRNNQFITDKSL